jgi:glycerate 2-kinase
VVGDPLDMIASGPTVPPSGRWQPVLDIVARYDLKAQFPAAVLKALHSPPQPPLFSAAMPNNILVGNNEIAARAAMAKAEGFGFSTQLMTTTLQGEARLVGEQMALQLREFEKANPPRPAVWVAGGETTVTLRGEGQGGRNQELALAAVPGLAGLLDGALITLATDGGDGPTNAAGAVVTGETLARAAALGLDPETFLRNNDSYTFFSSLEDCLTPGPTRTNVNDLLFLFLF